MSRPRLLDLLVRLFASRPTPPTGPTAPTGPTGVTLPWPSPKPAPSPAARTTLSGPTPAAFAARPRDPVGWRWYVHEEGADCHPALYLSRLRLMPTPEPYNGPR